MFEQYYFLFFLGLIWIIAASVNDLRKREVANWINFSLIAFGLSYRALYSAFNDNYSFFVYGVVGFGVFFLLANLFYYGKVFAGGDAKLLMGIGVLLPFEAMVDYLSISLSYVFLLFLCGAVYSAIFSIYLVNKNLRRFKIEFKKRIYSEKWNLYIIGLLGLLFFLLFDNWKYALYGYIFVLSMAILYLYLKSLDSCMIKLISPQDLTEGDWIEQEVTVAGKFIGKNVHGLSYDEIKLLRKHNRRVLIKEGIPFVPSFLFSFIIMVYIFLFYTKEFLQVLLSSAVLAF
jgi:Flp pilus assembly protein protease CpaA